MVINNHKDSDSIQKLEEKLLGQDFAQPAFDEVVGHYKRMAETYSIIENSIAVLSDLKAGKSYIYNSPLSEVLAIDNTKHTEIDSIFEYDIYNRIHTDDSNGRHLLEIQYFNFIKKIPILERSQYHTQSVIRMLNFEGVYIPISHRTFYLHSQPNGSLWLAMCLYNHAVKGDVNQSFKGGIVNTLTGESILFSDHDNQKILSVREKQILLFIEQGFLSKEIAMKINISKNTVDRHRQNILEKLNVSNSFEALKTARSLHLIDDNK